jgi:hypothetical protein
MNSTAIIDLYLSNLLAGKKIYYNSSIDKSETNEYIIWLIKWSYCNLTMIMYDKNTQNYFTNLNSNSPFWENICKNLTKTIRQCKIRTDLNIINNNVIIETDSPFNVCCISFGTNDE